MQLSPGASLGPYEIVAPLGAGGMGEVYRARDPRLGRDVAVKVLSRHLTGDAEALARFEHEARTVAALSHPNILAIHEFAVQDGMPYAVTELLEGESMRERLQRGPLPWREAASLAVAVADGLAAAHGRGIVHRDLKPENLFLLGDGRVKILDFGLARQVVLPDAGDQGITVAFGGGDGQVLGTIGYMSPEQARGGPVAVTSDIFSLGCVLYELVAGGRPFDYPTPAETIAAILHEDPRPLDASGAAVPEGLGQVIRHCLEKEPGARFSSARDTALALQAVLSDSSMRTPARGTRVARVPARVVAVLPFVNDGGDEELDYLSEGLADILVNTLATLPKLRVVPRTVVARYKGRAVEPARIGAELNATAIVTGRVLSRAGQVSVQAELVDPASGALLWGQRFVRPATEVFALQEALAADIADAVGTRLGGRRRTPKRAATPRHTPAPAAYDHYLRGKHAFQQWGPRALARAVEHFEQAILADPDYAPVWAGLANALGAAAYFGYVDPATAMPRGRAAAERAIALDPDDGEAHAALGVTLLFSAWDIARAGMALEKAIALNPGLAMSHVFLALQQSAAGRLEEAVATARRAEALDPVSPLPVLSVAWTLHFAGRLDESAAQVHRLLDLDPQSVTGHAMLAGDAELRRDFPVAIDRFEALLQLMQEPPDLAVALRRALADGGEPAYWREKLAQVDHSVGLFGPAPIVSAGILTAMGDPEAALDQIEAACDARMSSVVLMGVEPCFVPLRGLPRFEALLARVGLPASPAVVTTA